MAASTVCRSASVLALILTGCAGCSTDKRAAQRSAAPLAKSEPSAPAKLAEAQDTGGRANPNPSRVQAGLYYSNNVTFTAEVVASVRAIAARDSNKNDKVFIRIGDSLTSGGKDNTFGCFAAATGEKIDLDGRDLQSTITYFDQVQLTGGQKGGADGKGGASTSWDRDSLAALAGAGAGWVTRPYEVPPWSGAIPVIKEVEQTRPRFAVWMLGTNDTCSTPMPYRNGMLYREYANNILKTIDHQLTPRGVVPVLTFMPPVLGCRPEAHWETLDMVSIERAIAVARKLPTIDSFTEVEAVGNPAFYDGIHMARYRPGPCIFTPDGLKFGINIRNLRTLEVLDKLRKLVTSNVERLDPDPPAIFGKGTAADPIDIPGLPFAHSASLAGGGGTLRDYTSCGGDADRTGNEVVYRLTLTKVTPLRAIAVAGECESTTECNGNKEVTVAIFKDKPEMKSCLSAGATLAKGTLGPGSYSIVMDTGPGPTQPKTGIFALHQCMEGDTRCTPDPVKP